MKLSITVFTKTTISIRSIAKLYEELNKCHAIDTVSYSCIRQWVLRMGLGVLQQTVQKRNDWVYIIDFSIQLGTERCLLILGVTMEQLQNEGYSLNHKMVKVLDIYVQTNFNAERVHARLETTQANTGTPLQIISDRGADVKKGIELFCDNHNDVISSYDITHMIGIQIKHALSDNPQWKELQQELLSITQQTKQTELSFLRPVSMGTKARWLNISLQTRWLEKIYQYETNSDFSLINKGLKIKNSDEVFLKVESSCKTGNRQRQLRSQLSKKVFADRGQAQQWLNSKGLKDMEGVAFDDAGQIRFYEKFNTLMHHKQFFFQLKQLCNMSEGIKTIIKNKGLSLDTLQELENLGVGLTFPWVRKVFNNIVNQLVAQHTYCRVGNQPLLCCSDIIESIFGKFKVKAQQTVGGIYQTVLVIALICTDATEKMVGDILSKTKMSDVNDWFGEMMGKTNLAKRREAFNFT